MKPKTKFGKRQVYRIESARKWAQYIESCLKTALDTERREYDRTQELYIARRFLAHAQEWVDKAIAAIEEDGER